MTIRSVLGPWAVIATGGLLFGYMIGINSNVVTEGQLLCPDGAEEAAGKWSAYGYNQCYKVSKFGEGVLSSLSLIGASLSTLFCFRYADDMGRKLEVQVASGLYLLGSAIAAGSPALPGIVAGLFTFGLGIGFAMHAAPIYIAEISPADIRGTLVSAKEGAIVFGIFLGFLSGACFATFGSIGWRYMIGCASIFAIIMLCGIKNVPESPRFLALELSRGTTSVENVGAALRYYRGDSTADEVANELRTLLLVDSLDERQVLVPKNTSRNQVDLLGAFRYPWPLMIGCGLCFWQQITGQPSVLYFATNIFKSAGYGASAEMQSLAVGLVKVLATLFTVWRVDEYGRRLLLLVGIGMMIVALAMVGTSFLNIKCLEPGVSVSYCAQENLELPTVWGNIALGGLMLYVSGYQVGFGPISWVVISEVFPLNVRGSALAVAAMVNFGSNVVVTTLQPGLMVLLTPAGLFFAFLAFSVLSFLFVFALLPETKGLSLEEIETLMKPLE
jgi:sugar porter (SP) family MFS transporter